MQGSLAARLLVHKRRNPIVICSAWLVTNYSHSMNIHQLIKNVPMIKTVRTRYTNIRCYHTTKSNKAVTGTYLFNSETTNADGNSNKESVNSNSPSGAEVPLSYLEARRRVLLNRKRLLSPLQRISGMIVSDKETAVERDDESRKTTHFNVERTDTHQTPESSFAFGMQEHSRGNTPVQRRDVCCSSDSTDGPEKAYSENPPMVDGEYVLVMRENLKRQERLVRLVKLDANLLFKCKYGNISHADIIGHQSGTVFVTNMDIEILIRRPSLEEYVLYMKRYPVIAYPKDCCTMLMMIDASPGDIVLEAGTGSGAMTLFLSKAVGCTGQVYSFDRMDNHQKRAIKNYSNWQRSWDISHQEKWPENVSFYPVSLEESAAHIGNMQVDGAVIDMEGPACVMNIMSKRLKTGKAMAVYVANLTQVIELAESIRTQRLPLVMETTLEVSHKVWVVNPARRHGGTVLEEQRTTDSDDLFNEEEFTSGERYLVDQVPKYLTRPHHMQPSHTAFLVRIRKIRSSSATFKV